VWILLTLAPLAFGDAAPIDTTDIVPCEVETSCGSGEEGKLCTTDAACTDLEGQGWVKTCEGDDGTVMCKGGSCSTVPGGSWGLALLGIGLLAFRRRG